ncbi:MAG: class I SAM-dependent methyltransferase [Acidimicrobiales bacterium]
MDDPDDQHSPDGGPPHDPSAPRATTTTLAAALGLAAAAEQAAAVGAQLRAEAGEVVPHPLIADRLAAVTRAALPALGELDEVDRATVRGVVVAFLRQALDLFEHPDRPPSWSGDDREVLQAQGRVSMAIVDALAAFASDVDGLADRLSAPGAALCDVGTGTGWMAVAACRRWPALRVTGLDIHPPALDLARGNVASEGLAGRIEVRDQDVRALTDRDAFDLVWLPGPFLPAEVVPDALRSARRALRRDGWVVLGTYGGPDGAAQALLDLRTIRSGGHPWTPERATAVVRMAGFCDVREVPRTWAAPVRIVVGRRA